MRAKREAQADAAGAGAGEEAESEPEDQGPDEGAKFFFKKAESKRRATLYHVWHSSSTREILLAHSKQYKPSKVLKLDEVQHVRSVIYMNPRPENAQEGEHAKKPQETGPGASS